MAVTFQRAGKDDVATVGALIDAAYEHYIPILGGRKPRPMTDDHLARIERGETFILSDGGETVGVTSMSIEGAAVHIFNIAIHPGARGRGLLHAVFRFAEAMARESGASKLSLYTNMLMERNLAIYKHVGFTEVGREDVPGGYRIVLFERAVPAA